MIVTFYDTLISLNQRNTSKKYFHFWNIIYPEIENKLPRFAIFYRNKWMVEKANYVVASVDHDWGGAYITYKHAKRKEKFIFHLGKLQE